MSKNKKKLIIYAGDYMPFPSQNGVCLKSLIENWNKEFDITVIAKNQDNRKKYVDEDGIKYIFINSFVNRLQNNAKNKRGYIFKIVNAFLKILRGIKAAILWLRQENYLYRGYIKETKKLLNSEKIDCILAVCYPFSAIYAAYRIHQLFGIKYVTYILDDYCSAKNLRKICLFPIRYKKKDKEATINIMGQASYNFVSKGFVYSNIYDEVVRAKIPMQMIGFPLLPEKNKLFNSECKIDENNIKILYAGAFVKGVREPDALIKLFSLESLKNYKLILCTIGNYQETLKKWACNRNNIIFMGSVKREEAISLMKEADILLNVENLNLHQIPSKLFEYIQIGKPIINLYNFEEQRNVLKSYKRTLQIPQNDINEDIGLSVKKFIEQVNGEKMEWDQVLNSFKLYSKEYLSKLFYLKLIK